MTIVKLNKANEPTEISFFSIGFRPFFFGGLCFSIISISLWMAVFLFSFPLDTKNISAMQWHAHEMIYGYSVAIIAGFLLTAVGNWTGHKTTHGRKLVLLFSLWILARTTMVFGSTYLTAAMIFDIFFNLTLLFELGLPIVRSRNWKQIGILSKVLLLSVGNLVFYLSALSGTYSIRISIYGGLYLIVGLILTIGNRVFPSFVEAGLDNNNKTKDPKWLAIPSFILFLVFFINDLALNHFIISLVSSFGLFFITSFRLILWHDVNIWKKPLLWGLYLSFLLIDLGFLLFTISLINPQITTYLAVHALAFGGIGFSTMAMMARVTLGHTGRKIKNPPKTTIIPLCLLFLGVIFRIAFPIIQPLYYILWIFLAQILWITAFTTFLFIFAKMYFLPRVDNLEN